jgi:hypothetical protein
MNNQNNILLIDSKFDPNTSVDCNLLIKVGIDSFSYAIINKQTNKVIAVFDEQECEDGSKKLADCLKNDSYLSLTYKEVKISIHTANHIDVPNVLYDDENLHLNTQFFSEPYADKVYTIAQPGFGFTSIFSVRKSTAEVIEQSLASSKKFQQYAALLKLAENIEQSSLLLDFTVSTLNAVYLKDGKVVFQASYEVENTEEFNYYLLLMINQLGIATKNTTVLLSGIIHLADEKYICLQQYFNTIHFLNINLQVLEDMPSHYYSTLLALDQCV